MSTMVLIWVLVLWILLGVLFGGLLLWAGMRLLGTPTVGYLRCCAASLVVSIIQLPFLEPDLITGDRWPAYVQWQLLAVLIVLPWFAVTWVLRTSLFQTGAVYLFMQLFGAMAGVGLGMAWPVHVYLFEGFRIPNGAMAPTILGIHGDLPCTNCGLPIAVGLTDWVGADGTPRERQPLVTVCPNCHQSIHVPTDTGIQSGDRILVAKLGTPRRWDLAVFRYPENPENPESQQLIFVKRVVGLPGETVELCGGDLFVDGRRVAKPPEAAENMWILVHDTAYEPTEIQTVVPPQWQAASEKSGWTKEAGAWSFSPATAASVSDGVGLSPTALIFSGYVTDALAYNAQWPGSKEPSADVSDVRVTCRVSEFSGPGGFEFRWRFGTLSATAAIKATGEVEITANGASATGGRSTATGQLSAASSPQRTLGFAMRDGRATVLENGDAVASLEVGPQDIAAAKRLIATSPGPCRLAIVPRDCTLRLAQITLHRDVYYCNLAEFGVPLAKDCGEFGCTGHPITLGDDEYFTLGDNSRRSKDSRFWGTVKAATIIGLARCIYWPKDRVQRLD